jgi:hypothetical protein
MAEFKFPRHLEMGDRVAYSPDGTSKDKCLAWITEVKDSSAMSLDLCLIPTGELRRDCWHADDPRVETHSHIFTQQEDRGVFRLIGDQSYREMMSRRLDALERLCQDLVKDNGRMKLEINRMQPSKPLAAAPLAPPPATYLEQKRGPGRPRKVPAGV